MEKIYDLNKNVYEAAQERLDYLFSEFNYIYISFSGGKDSGVVLNLVLDYMRKHNITKKIGVFHRDVECQYNYTTEYVKRSFENNLDLIDPYWCCLPVRDKTQIEGDEKLRWITWDPEKKDVWTRDMPDQDFIINENNNPFDFFQFGMKKEDLYNKFGIWYRDNIANGEKVCDLLGLRANESLDRYNSVVNRKNTYEGRGWIGKKYKDMYVALPIYDWTEDDIWTANGKFNYDYNRIYDAYYLRGLTIHQMRVSPPFHNKSFKQLDDYKAIEPETYNKFLDRVGNVGYGALYGKSEATGHGGKVILPAHYKTYEEYYYFLLTTLTDREIYERKVINILDRMKKEGLSITDSLYKKICAVILRGDNTFEAIDVGYMKKKQNEKKDPDRFKNMMFGGGYR